MKDIPDYLKCTKPQLHNFVDLDDDTCCSWCGLKVKEIKKIHFTPWWL